MTAQIILPEGYVEITATTDLRLGFQLTPNISLDALTRGVINTSTYPFRTVQTFEIADVVDPNSSFADEYGIELPEKWKIARNLQYLAAGIIEPLIAKYPGDVTILASYINPQAVAVSGDAASKHYTGEAVDIILNTKEGNMFGVAGEIYQLVGAYCVEFGLIFSSRSWIHLAINGPMQAANKTVSTTQAIYTKDLSTGENYNGLYPARGTLVPETLAMNGILDSYPWGSFNSPPFVLY